MDRIFIRRMGYIFYLILLPLPPLLGAVGTDNDDLQRNAEAFGWHPLRYYSPNSDIKQYTEGERMYVEC